MPAVSKAQSGKAGASDGKQRASQKGLDNVRSAENEDGILFTEKRMGKIRWEKNLPSELFYWNLDFV